MDGPGGRVLGVKPQNLVVVVGLLDLLGDLFAVEVLPRLDPADLCRCAAVSQALRAACGADAPTAGRITRCLFNAAQGLQQDNVAATRARGCGSRAVSREFYASGTSSTAASAATTSTGATAASAATTSIQHLGGGGHKAAESGHMEAQKHLSRQYVDGWGVGRNLAEAAKWTAKAAEQGDAVSQSVLGDMYSIGKGVERNDALAVKWYRRAAEQQDPVAQSNLGMCYQEGEGVARDITLAMEWFTKAAAQGSAGAHVNLALCFESGEAGVEQNLALAGLQMVPPGCRPRALARHEVCRRVLRRRQGRGAEPRGGGRLVPHGCRAGALPQSGQPWWMLCERRGRGA